MILYDLHAPKKATNLSINSDLLKKAKALHINLSKTLEQALIDIIKEKQKQIWLAENREAIEDYNRRIEKYGSFADRIRELEKNGSI